MLEQYVTKGAQDACARLKLANNEVGLLGGLMGKARSFGAGQVGAGKDLFSNLKGGFGKAAPPMPMGQEGPAAPTPEQFRGKAVGNLKTLAPSLLAGGGLYMMHRHNQQQQEQQQQQQQAMAQGGYGQPMM